MCFLESVNAGSLNWPPSRRNGTWTSASDSQFENLLVLFLIYICFLDGRKLLYLLSNLSRARADHPYNCDSDDES